MDFNTSRIPGLYQQAINAMNREWDPVVSGDIYGSLVIAISNFLGATKEKKQKVAIVVSDLKGNFRLAGIVQYHENENPEMPGNWSYVLTFNEKDIDEAKRYESNDDYFHRFLADAFYTSYSWKFIEPDFVQDMIITCCNVLLDWLDKNASESEVMEIELEGRFKASVAIEHGEKVFAIVPDGSMKRLIKGDAEIAK